MHVRRFSDIAGRTSTRTSGVCLSRPAPLTAEQTRNATQEVDLSKSRSGAPRRAAVGLLAGALSVVGIALAPPAGAVDDVNADRLAGINRYGTAAAIAGQYDF